MFNIFKRRKKLSLKELYAPVLDEMWCCVVNFSPMDPNQHGVVFKKVNIVKAEADKEGIWVESDFPNPFYKYTKEPIKGYVDKIGCCFHTAGFFETKEAAEKAYNELMQQCIDVIKRSMVKEESK